MSNKKKYERTCRFCGVTVEFYHGEKLSCCPQCGASDYVKPATETALFLLQKKWIETRDKKILGQMYVILCSYVKSKIKKILNGVIIYEDDKLEEKAIDSVNLLMEYYLTKDDFKIESSFMGYLTKQINTVLYNKATRQIDEVESLNAIIDEHNKKELIDIINILPLYESSMNNDFVFNNHKEEDLIKGIMSIVKEAHDAAVYNYSKYIAILILIGLHHSISRRSEEYKNRFYSRFGNNKIEGLVEQTMTVIYNFIRDEQ